MVVVVVVEWLRALWWAEAEVVEVVWLPADRRVDTEVGAGHDGHFRTRVHL